MPDIGIGIGINMASSSRSWTPLYDKILATQPANILAYLPLNDVSGTVALNKGTARSGINIVKNPSFENATIAWYGWNNNLGNGSRTLVTDDVHSAGNAAKLTAVSTAASINQTVNVKPDSSYTLEIWTHGDNTNSLTVQVERGDNAAYLVNESSGITGTTYSKYTKTFTAPAGYTTALLRCLKTATAGSVWVDDIKLSCNEGDAPIFDGTYVGTPILNQNGLSGKSVLLEGTQCIAINKPAYANSTPIAGSFVIYGKPTLASLTDGAARWMLKLKTKSSGTPTPNYIDCFKDAASNKIGWQFNSDTGESIYRVADWSTPDWFSLGMTWSANGLKLYLNGVQAIATISVNPVWTQPFDYTIMTLGGQSSDASDIGQWKGELQHFAYWDTELTAAEMLKVGINMASSSQIWTQPLARNSGIVEAGGYSSLTTTANLSNGAAGRSFLNKNNLMKVRQIGSITKVRFYTRDITTSGSIYFQVWRKNGSNYDLVAEENILDRVGQGVTNEITLNAPISVLEGDYYGIALIPTTSGDGVNVVSGKTTGTNTSMRYFDSATRPTGNAYDWDAKPTLTNYILPLKVFMQAPLIVAIGDSIIAGHPSHYSYIEDSLTDSRLNQILAQLYLIDNKYVYQNLGIGSQTTTDIATRFAADVIPLAPKMAIIQGGVNDIFGGVISEATFLANYTTMLELCKANGIIPIVCSVLPWTAGSNANMQKRDLWMADLHTLVNTYANSVWIDFDSDIGQNRVGGDANNLWDIKTAYNADDVHLNIDGYTKMAQVINTNITGITKQPATKPIVLSGLISNLTPTNVVLSCNTVLNETSIPATTDFALAGKTISNVAISGSTITLTVSVAYVYGDAVTLNYTKPATNFLKASEGSLAVDSFTGQSILNSIAQPKLFYDTCTGADNTAIDSHTPDIGGAYTTTSGALKIVGNRIKATTSGAYNSAIFSVGKSDIVYTCNITMPTGANYQGGIQFRYKDETHRWRLYILRASSGTPTLNLLSYITGKGSANLVHGNGVTHKLKVEAIGQTINVYWDDVLKITVPNQTDNQTETKAGIEIYYDGTYPEIPIDDLTIREYLT